MRRLWSAGASPEMPFLAPEPVEPIETVETVVTGKIDHPEAETEIEGETITISGWVAFGSGPTSRVEAWLGDSPLGRARLGLPRPDVEEASDAPFAAISGFELNADLSAASTADRESGIDVRVIATGADGARHEFDPLPVALVGPAKAPEPTSLPRLVFPRPRREGRGLRTMVVTHQLNLGGAQLYLMDLLNGLLSCNAIEPTVVSAMDGSLREGLEAMGIPVHITSMFPTDDIVSHLGRVEELAAWAAPHEFELALVNTATTLSFPGAEVAASLGIPALWAIHESFPPAVIWSDLDPEVRDRAEGTLSKAAFAIFEAEATQRLYEPLIDPSRCRTLPYGLDLTPIDRERASFDVVEARRDAGIPESAQVLLCVGTVEPRKAQVTLAQAFELIADHHPDARLVFVGGREDDPHSMALEECIKVSRAGDRIELIPITPNVQRWYGLADILVCASDVESLPRTVLEAMAWETPVLATSVFGLPELITEGETGWMCEPRDTVELANALDRALSSSQAQRERIGGASRLLVERRHSLNDYAREVRTLLNRASHAAAAHPNVA